jgi:hypothetical protein
VSLDAIGQRKWRPVRAFMVHRPSVHRGSHLRNILNTHCHTVLAVPESFAHTVSEPPAETLAATALYTTRTSTVTRACALRHRKHGALQIDAHHDSAGH